MFNKGTVKLSAEVQRRLEILQEKTAALKIKVDDFNVTGTHVGKGKSSHDVEVKTEGKIEDGEIDWPRPAAKDYTAKAKVMPAAKDYTAREQASVSEFRWLPAKLFQTNITDHDESRLYMCGMRRNSRGTFMIIWHV